MRAAITGYGIVCPAGNNIQEFTAFLRRGKQRLDHLTGVPLPRGKSAVGVVTDPRFKAVDRAYQMCAAAVAEALQSIHPSADHHSTALLLSTLAADSRAVEDVYPKFRNNGISDPHLREILPLYSNGTLLNKLSNYFGLEGPQLVVSNACASGNIALGLALDMIRSGRCRTAVVPGVELVKLSMLWGAERSAFIGRALRPFHRNRDGSILGEGAAAVVLQHEEDVDARSVLGWLEGFGFGVEAIAGAITLNEDGSGLRQSMTLALEDAARRPEEIEYINAHAPGTPAIDRIECKAIRDLFGAHSAKVAVNSTKSMSTHLSAASGIVEVIATLVQMREGFIHANCGLDEPDPALSVKVVGPETISQRVARGLSNACGGGGLNTTVVITAPDERGPEINSNPSKAGHDVVITGLGVISPWGGGPHLPAQATPEHTPAGQLNWFDIHQYYPQTSNYSYYNRAGQLGAAAGAIALSDASLDGKYGNDRVAVLTGTFLGGQTQCNTAICQALMENPNSITPSMVLDHGPHLPSSMVRRHYGYYGPTCTFTGSRVAGLQALVTGCDMLATGRADAAVIIGNDGLDESLHKAAAMLNGCLPHDRLSEGAGAAILELKDRAAHRRVTPRAIIRNWILTASNLRSRSKLKSTADRLAAHFHDASWEAIHITGHHGKELEEFAQAFMKSVGRDSVIHKGPDSLMCCLAADAMFTLAGAAATNQAVLLLAVELEGAAVAIHLEPARTERD